MAKKSYKSRPKKEKKKKAYTSPTLENNLEKVPFSKRLRTSLQENYALPSTGSVFALIFALLILVVAFAKLTGAEYTPVSYWLEVLQDMPVTIDLQVMFNLIPSVVLPEWLGFLEGIINFVVNLINLSFGCVSALINCLQVILYFLGKLLALVGA